MAGRTSQVRFLTSAVQIQIGSGDGWSSTWAIETNGVALEGQRPSCYTNVKLNNIFHITYGFIEVQILLLQSLLFTIIVYLMFNKIFIFQLMVV